MQLLAHIRSMFAERQTDRLSSETIVQSLQDDGAGPNRVPLTQAQLARLLAPFGIRPTIVHRSRTQVRRGYLAKDFQTFVRDLCQ